MPIRCYDRPRGFTLIETMISATLVLLVFGLGARFLIPLMRMQVKGSERAELQQRCAIALEELRHDVALSTAGGISLVQSPNEILLGIHPADNVAQDGTLVWDDTLVVYKWKSRDALWHRGVWSDPGRRQLRAGAPTRLSDPALRQAASEMKITRITPGLAAVALDPPGPNVSLPLTVKLSLLSPTGEKREQSRVMGGRLPVL